MSTKERESSSTSVCVWTDTYPSADVNFGPVERVVSRAKIIDSRPRPGVNCQHYQYSAVFAGNVTGRTSSSPSDTNTFTLINPAFSPSSIGTWITSEPYCWYSPFSNDFASEAYQAMRPTMTTDLSLSNFLLELGDVKSLFKLWDRTLPAIKNFANGHLNYSFGWKPLRKDLMALMEGMLSFEKRFASLLERQGKPQRSHFRKRYTQSPQVSGDVPISQDLVWYGKSSLTISEAICCATMGYSFTLPRMSLREMKIRAYLDSLGLSCKPSQFWEAIPFSFLVDWFVQIKGALEKLESNMLEPTMQVTSMVYSAKVKYSLARFVQCRGYNASNSFCPVATFTGSYYQRWAGLPMTFALPDVTLQQSLGHVLLGTSLYIQRK